NNKDKKYYLLETKDRVVKVFANRKGKLERPKVHIEKDKQGKILSINIEENSRLELEKKLKSIKEKHNLNASLRDKPSLGLRQIPLLAFALLTQATCQSLTSRWDSGSGNFVKAISLCEMRLI
ncbi:hypothetical protein, partial [Leptospira vanthielii]|uniref:hypothetical protein n=1 Tax=Leptospira vanthielii TaxID=293085 RepID=UPI00058731BE